MKIHLVELNELVDNISKRKSQYIVDENYNTLASFIMGYMYSVRISHEIDLSTAFQRWLQQDQRKYFSIHWSAYIYKELSKFNDAIAAMNLLKLIEKFTKANI